MHTRAAYYYCMFIGQCSLWVCACGLASLGSASVVGDHTSSWHSFEWVSLFKLSYSFSLLLYFRCSCRCCAFSTRLLRCFLTVGRTVSLIHLSILCKGVARVVCRRFEICILRYFLISTFSANCKHVSSCTQLCWRFSEKLIVVTRVNSFRRPLESG